MINEIKKNILQIAEKIEQVYSKYQLQIIELNSNQDLTADAKKRKAWELYEKAKAEAEELSNQGFKELKEANDILTRQLTQAQAKDDNEGADPEQRAKVEALKEQLETELIAAGPFEYLKELSRLIEGKASPLRLEAARAVLPSLKVSLFEEMYSRETGGQVLNPWGNSKGVINPENSQLIKVELQDLARKISDSLKPDAVKTYEADLKVVRDLENEIAGAFNRTSRLLNKTKPANQETWGYWASEEYEKEALS